MRCRLLLLGLLAGTPALAQNVIGESPVLEGGGVTCGAFVQMSLVDRLGALSAVEPLGGELASAEPSIAAQWADRVAAVCRGRPDLLIEDAARTALGGN